VLTHASLRASFEQPDGGAMRVEFARPAGED
jgi:hypothetical protein